MLTSFVKGIKSKNVTNIFKSAIKYVWKQCLNINGLSTNTCLNFSEEILAVKIKEKHTITF